MKHGMLSTSRTGMTQFNLEIFFYIRISAVSKTMKRLEDSDDCRAETKYRIKLREAAITILQRITTRTERSHCSRF